MKIIYKDTRRGSIFDYAIVDGEKLTQEGLAKLAGCSPRTLKRRMAKMSLEKAVYGSNYGLKHHNPIPTTRVGGDSPVKQPTHPFSAPINVPKRLPVQRNRGQNTDWLASPTKAKRIEVTDESKKRGRNRRKVDLLRDLKELGNTIGEAWIDLLLDLRELGDAIGEEWDE